MSSSTPLSQWYNPNHPDADWSGFVRPRQARKHPSQTPPAMLVQISPANKNGICPCEGAETSEWTKPGRKMEFGTAGGKNSRHINMNGQKSPTFSLIGGPTPALDPSKVGSITWETEAQAAMRQNGTRVGQLTTYGRSIHIRGRKETIPAFELANGFDKEKHDVMRKENPYELNNKKEEDDEQYYNEDSHHVSGLDSSNLIGYRAHKGGAAKSFLTGLGKQIIDNVEVRHSISTAPFATDGNTPTDPYMTGILNKQEYYNIRNQSGAH